MNKLIGKDTLGASRVVPIFVYLQSQAAMWQIFSFLKNIFFLVIEGDA